MGEPEKDHEFAFFIQPQLENQPQANPKTRDQGRRALSTSITSQKVRFTMWKAFKQSLKQRKFKLS